MRLMDMRNTQEKPMTKFDVTLLTFLRHCDEAVRLSVRHHEPHVHLHKITRLQDLFFIV